MVSIASPLLASLGSGAPAVRVLRGDVKLLVPYAIQVNGRPPAEVRGDDTLPGDEPGNPAGVREAP